MSTRKPTSTAATTRAPAAPRRRAAGNPPAPAQPDRHTAILLAAEKLFALHGYHAVSIRDIATEAGVPLALVGYYYGAKHDLYFAIFESWSSVIRGRVDGLASVLAEPDPALRLRAILDAFASPLIALHQHPEGQYYALMAARDLAAPTPESSRANEAYFDPLARAYIDALMGTAPGVSRGRAAWCYQFMLGALLHFLSDRRVERLSDGENRGADPRAKEHLLAFLEAGCRAVLGVIAPPAATPGDTRTPRATRAAQPRKRS